MRSWLGLAVVAAAFLCAGCRERVIVDELVDADEYLATGGTRGPAVTAPASPTDLVEVGTLTLPDSIRTNGISTAAVVAIDDLSGCIVAVGDRATRAIHFFEFGGRYLHTLEGGAPEPGLLGSLNAMTFGPNGSLWVSEANGGRISLLDPLDGRRTAAIELETLPDRLEPSTTWISESGAVFTFAQIAPHTFVLGESPVRGWTREGRPAGTWGELTPFPGGPFTAAMNRGSVGGVGETLFVLQHATGRLLAYDALSPSATARSVRTIPQLFPAPNPRHGRVRLVGDDGTILDRARMRGVEYSEHVTGLSVDPRGNSFFIQYASPLIPDEITKAERRTLLGLLAPDEGAPVYFTVGDPVLAIAAGADYLALVTAAEMPSRSGVQSVGAVSLVENPTSDTSASRCPA